MQRLHRLIVITLSLLLPTMGLAAEGGPLNLHLTNSAAGYLALSLFAIAYFLVMNEEFTHLRKSKPVVLAAGVIWAVIAWAAAQIDQGDAIESAIRHNILEFSELFLFLLVAMTYVNALEERQVFDTLRAWLVRRGFSYRGVFWMTGALAFCLSPIADNLTTALLMCAVVMAVGANHPKFIAIACINVVVAANAGGAFSPFGDITTLMVWQKNKLQFFEFFSIFVPSLVAYLVPAVLMHFAVPKEQPTASGEVVKMKFGAKRIMILFLLTILTTVCFHNFLHLPPVIGMMTGLAYLQFFAYYLKITGKKRHTEDADFHPFDIFNKIKRAEWDTLLFFYGVILCVGGLATLGYLELTSNIIYNDWGTVFSAAHSATPGNIAIGIFSAILDNIPMMFAVLTMNPTMSEGQWLLVTLTAGIGGSLLSIGSAAGVALMGQARGHYTFMKHLKWTWAIFLGYAAAIATHLCLNAGMFT